MSQQQKKLPAHYVYLFFSLVFGLGLCGCSSKSDFSMPNIEVFDDELEPMTVRIIVTDNVNPDDSGRPSPMELRIYQLTSSARFSSADLYSLLQDETNALGADLKTSERTTVFPGANQAAALEVTEDVQFIGVFGAFQQINDAKAKMIIAIDGDDPEDLCIKINARTIEMSNEC